MTDKSQYVPSFIIIIIIIITNIFVIIFTKDFI